MTALSSLHGQFLHRGLKHVICHLSYIQRVGLIGTMVWCQYSIVQFIVLCTISKYLLTKFSFLCHIWKLTGRIFLEESDIKPSERRDHFYFITFPFLTKLANISRPTSTYITQILNKEFYAKKKCPKK